MFHFNYQKLWGIGFLSFVVLQIETSVEEKSKNTIALRKDLGRDGRDLEYEQSHGFAYWVLQN